MISQMPTRRSERYLHGHPGEPDRRADADEVGDADADVGDQHGARGEHRPADAVLLAHELGQALAGDDAHARRQRLHDRQRDRDQHHRPQQRVAVLGADRGVRGDAAGVVARVGRDQPRSEQAEEGEQARAARAKPCRQARSATRGRPDTTHDGRYSDRHRARPLRPPACIPKAPCIRSSRRAARNAAASRAEHRLEHVVDGHHADHPLLVGDRDRGQVVVGHLPRDLLEGGVGRGRGSRA